MKAQTQDRLAIGHKFLVECYGPDGRLLWSEQVKNLIVNTGLNDILDKYYKGSSYSAAHYVGLTDGTPEPNAADTMASHAGWAEVVGYSEGVRQTLTLGTVSSQSVNNSAAKAIFSVNASITVGGAFITTDDTKSGTAGTLIGVAAFSEGDYTVHSGSTINVTVTASASSS